VRERSIVFKAASKLLRESTIVLAGSGAYQVLSFLTGLWIVRTLPIEQYALYGIALSVGTVLSAIADSGISQAVTAIGGRSPDNKTALGHLVATCRRFVAFTALIALAIAIPLWAVLASRQGATPTEAIILGILLAAGLLASLGGNIYRNLLLLNGKIMSHNTVEAGAAGLRLIVSIGLLLVWPTAIAAFFVGILAFVVRKHQLQRKASPLFTAQLKPTKEYADKITPLVQRAMPNSIYVAFSHQLLFFALAFLASPQIIAGASALSRFNQIYLFVPAIVLAVLGPRFAKTQAPHLLGTLFRRYFIIGAGLGLSLGGLMYTFPRELLLILGPEYAGLEREVRIFAVASSAACITGVMSGLNNARGWVVPPALYITFHLLALASSFLLFKPDSVSDYFTMMLYINAIMALVIVGWSLFAIQKAQRGVD
jgi:O-antigen/teichoic acid export membrane protein